MAVRLKDDKVNVIQWNVPLTQFQVDRQSYRPCPPLFSPIAVLSTDHLSLQWQLSLEQGVKDANLFVHHRTPHVPNQGVSYAVFALRTDGTTVRVTDEVRRALAKYHNSNSASTPAGSVGRAGGTGLRRGLQTFTGPFFKPGTEAAREHLVDQLVWNGDTIKLRITIGWSNQAWDPRQILSQMIQIYNKNMNFAQPPGIVGELLWTQVKILNHPADPMPPSTDFLLVCPNGVRIAAHCSVLAAFCEPFRKVALSAGSADTKRGASGPLIMHSMGLGVAALYEVIQFIYLRRLSPRIDQIPLNELLEAADAFQLPVTVRWEIEKVLALILDEFTRERMEVLADKYNLKILKNMITKSYMDSAKLDKVHQERGSSSLLSSNRPRPGIYVAKDNIDQQSTFTSLTEIENNKVVIDAREN